MRSKRWMLVCATTFFLCVSGPTFAQGKGHGNGHGHDKDDDSGWYGGDDDGGDHGHGHGKHSYRDHDREVLSWYHDHEGNLPPGLAKRDRLPPGLEKQLVVRGTLPPGLQKKIQPAPPELVRILPPPPPDCEHVVIGGNLVLVNRRSWLVVDVFHFEL